MITVAVKAKIKTPQLPNFLLAEDGQKIPIADVADADLNLIGEQWTKELIELARQRRRQKP